MDYTKLDDLGLLAACGDNADKWAEACAQHAEKQERPKIDQHWLMGWFANAIEHCTVVRSKGEVRSVEPDWERTTYELFKTLDDIDTADDIAKGNESLYRNLVRRHHEIRFNIVSRSDQVALYDKFYPKDINEMSRNEQPVGAALN